MECESRSYLSSHGIHFADDIVAQENLFRHAIGHRVYEGFGELLEEVVWLE